MAEEGKREKRVVVAGGVRGPEIGPPKKAATAQTFFEWAKDLRDNNPELLKAGLTLGAEKGDIRCIKLLLDLANGVGLSAGTPEAEYRSFAEELRELFRLELAEMEKAGVGE